MSSGLGRLVHDLKMTQFLLGILVDCEVRYSQANDVTVLTSLVSSLRHAARIAALPHPSRAAGCASRQCHPARCRRFKPGWKRATLIFATKSWQVTRGSSTSVVPIAPRSRDGLASRLSFQDSNRFSSHHKRRNGPSRQTYYYAKISCLVQ